MTKLTNPDVIAKKYELLRNLIASLDFAIPSVNEITLSSKPRKILFEKPNKWWHTCNGDAECDPWICVNHFSVCHKWIVDAEYD